MSNSLNGWDVVEPSDRSDLVTRTVPGTSIRLTLHKDAAPLLLWIAARVNREVCPLEHGNDHPTGQDDGGWNYREARFANGFSNHASGSAVDLNWRKWPARVKRMTPAERAAAKRIARDVASVVTWGGDWTRIPDEMHWEVRDGVTAAQVAAFCKSLGINKNGVIRPKKESA